MEIKILAVSKNNVLVYEHPAAHPHRMDLAAEAIKKMVIPVRPADPRDRSQTRIAATVDIGRKIGICHLVKTKKNDATIMYDRGRGYMSRIALFRHGKPETRLTSVLFWDPDNKAWVLWTNFEGDEGMPEPGCDRYERMSREEQAQCREFWSNHALVLDKEERNELCRKLVDEYRAEREWVDSYWWGGMGSLEWNSRDAMLRDWYDRVISKIE